MTTNTTPITLEVLAESRIRRKEHIELLTKQLEELDQEIIQRMEEDGVTSVESVVGKVNLIQSETIVWNKEVLKGLLSPSQWKRIIKVEIDKAKLDAELTIGRIDGDAVQVARTVKRSKKFLR